MLVSQTGRSKSSATENDVKRLSADLGPNSFGLAWRKCHRPAPLEMLYTKLLMERISGKGLDPCHVQFALSSRCLWIRHRPSRINQIASGSQFRHVSGRLSDPLDTSMKICRETFSLRVATTTQAYCSGLSRNHNRNRNQTEVTPWTKIYRSRNR